ncbi:MAG: hypothetical protein Q8R37_02470 [Nanoarchaeota archaeon]|nr:hypothetical protein [Nanoarchaeota archaeon]
MSLTKLLQRAVLGVGLAASACGDTTNNYYDQPIPEERQSYNNPCGNSPVYGKFLWEISDCKGSFYPKQDCTLEASTKDFQADIENDYRKIGTYNGLNLQIQGEDDGLTYDLWLDPTARAEAGPGQDPYWQKVNEMLDKYGGFLLFGLDSGSTTDLDDNAFIPLDIPFVGKIECKSSPYYAGDGY